MFRFTCRDTQAPCKLSFQATGPAGTTVYPRILIYKQDFNAGGPSTTASTRTAPQQHRCSEYGFEPVGSP